MRKRPFCGAFIFAALVSMIMCVITLTCNYAYSYAAEDVQEVRKLSPRKSRIAGFKKRYTKKYRSSVKDRVLISPAYGRTVLLKRYDPYLKKWVTEKKIKTPEKKRAKITVKYTGTWRSYPSSKWRIVAPKTRQRELNGRQIPPLKKASTETAMVYVKKFHNARHAVILDAETGKCLYAYKATSPTYIASMRKMMTGTLLAEKKKPGAKLTIKGVGTQATLGLRVGDVVRAKDLLHAMFLPSANDAADAAALAVGGSKKRFLRMMNRKARKLRMKKTSYSSPVGDGLSRRHTTTAYDQALLGKYIMESRTTSYLRKVMLKKHYSFTTLRYHKHYGGKKMDWGNKLIGTKYKSIGIKTGYNAQARWCFCNAWRYKGRLYISVVTGNPTRKKRWDSVKALTRFTKYAVDHRMSGVTVEE